MVVPSAPREAPGAAPGEVVVRARRVDRPVRPPASVGWADAVAAGERFAGFAHHPFPGCVVCGTDRARGDGLRLFTGPVAGRAGVVAGTLVPHPSYGRDDGRLPLAAVWAVLDCPTGWAHAVGSADGVALLGRMTGRVHARLRAGEAYVVVAEAGTTEGRRSHARGAIYDTGGRLVAASLATWVATTSPS